MSIDNYFSRFQGQSGFRSNLRIVGIILVLFCILAINPPIFAQKEKPIKGEENYCQHKITNLYPPAFDWRDVGGYNFVSPVKNQLACFACTAFAVTATLESVALIQHFNEGRNELLENLSETTLFFCQDTSHACNDTQEVADALRYCRDTGLISTTGLGNYEAIAEACKGAYYSDKCLSAIRNFRVKYCEEFKSRIVIKISAYGMFFNPKSIKTHISAKGPVIFSFRCDEEKFIHYRGESEDGIFKINPTGGASHSACCIGYDDKREAWLCKNSMGTDWGDAGFFWLAYLEDGDNNYEYLKAYYIDGIVEIESYQ